MKLHPGHTLLILLISNFQLLILLLLFFFLPFCFEQVLEEIRLFLLFALFTGVLFAVREGHLHELKDVLSVSPSLDHLLHKDGLFAIPVCLQLCRLQFPINWRIDYSLRKTSPIEHFITIFVCGVEHQLFHNCSERKTMVLERRVVLESNMEVSQSEIHIVKDSDKRPFRKPFLLLILFVLFLFLFGLQFLLYFGDNLLKLKSDGWLS